MIDLWVERACEQAIPHQWVRERVAGLVGGQPGTVPLQVDTCGALSLRTSSRHLSLSHHRDWLALAVSDGAPVGVDVLTIPEHADFVADTALVLSAAEIAFVRSLPPAQQGAAFAECWVRKEAYAKLRRTGLTAELPAMTFSPTPIGVPENAFWTVRVEDAFVSVATIGARRPTVRLHSRVDSSVSRLHLRWSNHQ